MPTLKIDGQEITVEAGSNLVEAAKQIGVEIPTFCYHDHLSVAANCRMCLVQGSQNGRAWPKPQPACQVKAADGMEIDASSDEVKKLRKAVLEFILINHPLDCPICDKAGECSLQNNYFAHSNEPSRFREVKVEKPKRVDLGPRIVYDGERCITCTRCVRFMEEIARSPQLGVIHRGDKALIATATERPLEHDYSVNIVDICPVGALGDKAFRFQQRVWFLHQAESICTGCARGCNVVVDTSEVDNKVYRIRPRENAAVNGPWMCDAGRLTFHEIHEGRLLHARVKGEGDVNLGSALDMAVAKLQPFFGAEELAVALSPSLSTEDAFAAALLAKDLLDVEKVTLIGRSDWEADAFLKLADHNPNRRGVQAVVEALGLQLGSAQALLDSIESGDTKALLVVGDHWPVEALDRVAAALGKLETAVVLQVGDDLVSQAAELALPLCGFAESDAIMVNAFDRVQLLHQAAQRQHAARPAWELLSIMAKAAGQPLPFRDRAGLLSKLAERVPLFAELTDAVIGAQGLARGDETKAPKFFGDTTPKA